MKCPKCGNEIANDSVFCEYCGTEIKEYDANKESNAKRVDIRLALLPAMLIATFAMWMRWTINSSDSATFLEELGSIAMIPPIILFLISLWNRIRNKTATSFVIIMGALLCLNYAMCCDIFDNREESTYYTDISWCDEGYERKVYMIDSPWYDAWPTGRPVFEETQQKLVKLLDSVGISVLHYSDIKTEYRYYVHKDLGYIAWEITIVVFVFYIFYVLIAHKKGWRF